MGKVVKLQENWYETRVVGNFWLPTPHVSWWLTGRSNAQSYPFKVVEALSCHWGVGAGALYLLLGQSTALCYTLSKGADCFLQCCKACRWAEQPTAVKASNPHPAAAAGYLAFALCWSVWGGGEGVLSQMLVKTQVKVREVQCPYTAE